jgi:hypothetical protein
MFNINIFLRKEMKHMTPDNLTITLPILNNGSDEALLIGMAPIMEYDKESRKRTDKQLGISYMIVLNKNNFEKINVKVGDLKSAIPMEDLEEKNAVKCTFKGFKARFYRDFKTNSYLLTASADAIIILDDDDEITL